MLSNVLWFEIDFFSNFTFLNASAATTVIYRNSSLPTRLNWLRYGKSIQEIIQGIDALDTKKPHVLYVS